MNEIDLNFIDELKKVHLDGPYITLMKDRPKALTANFFEQLIDRFIFLSESREQLLDLVEKQNNEIVSLKIENNNLKGFTYDNLCSITTKGAP